MTRLRAASPWLLAGLLGLSGTLHFAVPGPYDGLIPGWLPLGDRFWTYASGAGELLCGALVAHPRTRRRGALLTAVLFVVVFPGNLTSALNADTTGARVITYARLPLQVPLVLWALQVAGVRAGRRRG